MDSDKTETAAVEFHDSSCVFMVGVFTVSRSALSSSVSRLPDGSPFLQQSWCTTCFIVLFFKRLMLRLQTTILISRMLLFVVQPMIAKSGLTTVGSKNNRSAYRLYACSNSGSIVALVGYPSWVEPWFSAAHRSLIRSWGFWAFWFSASGPAFIPLRWRRYVFASQRSDMVNSNGSNRRRINRLFFTL